MKILITGGAGFIGSHLCDALLKKGHAITVVDNLVLGKIENIQHIIAIPNFTFVKGDLLDMEFMRTVFAEGGFDMVYHLAANSDIQKGSKDPMVDHDLTFQTTFNVLQLMKEFEVKKLFFASTSSMVRPTTFSMRTMGLFVLSAIMGQASSLVRRLFPLLPQPTRYRSGSLGSLMSWGSASLMA